jgi:hypothetical protein
MTGEETISSYFKMLYRFWPGVTEENQEHIHSDRNLVKTDSGTYLLQLWVVVPTPVNLVKFIGR